MNLTTKSPLWLTWYHIFKYDANGAKLLDSLLDGKQMHFLYQFDDNDFVFISMNTDKEDTVVYCDYDTMTKMYADIDNSLICNNIHSMPSNNNTNDHFFLDRDIDAALMEPIKKLIEDYEKMEDNQ